MKSVLINNLKGGEILAQEVLDHNGSLWLAEGAVYKEAYLSKLKQLDIKNIYIQDHSKENNNLSHKKAFNPDVFREENKRIISKQFKKLQTNGSINAYKFERLVCDLIDDILESTNILENMYGMRHYNNYTYEHLVNVTVIGIMISKKMDLSRDKIYETAMGCILHDLGKIKITGDILDKPSVLTTEEFARMKQHTIEGYELVKHHYNLSSEVKAIILNHHEKLDGSGYPFGIGANKISMGTRICTISDIFDAMCSERPYKMAVPFAESIRTMKSSMSKQLDMDICQVLEKVLK